MTPGTEQLEELISGQQLLEIVLYDVLRRSAEQARLGREGP